MARKRSIFLCRIQRLLSSLPRQIVRRVSAFMLLALLGLLLTFSLPAISATSALRLAVEGQRFYEIGEFAQAADMWKQAAEAYQKEGDRDGKIESLINRASALQQLGNFPRACNLLLETLSGGNKDCQELIDNYESFNLSLNSSSDKAVINNIRGLRLLGILFRQQGSLELSLNGLNQSLVLAENFANPEEKAATIISLGDTYRDLKIAELASDPLGIPSRMVLKDKSSALDNFLSSYYQPALERYELAGSLEAFPTTKARALLNRLSLLLDIKNNLVAAIDEAVSEDINVRNVENFLLPELDVYLTNEINLLLPNIYSELSDLTLNRAALYTQINLAHNLTRLSELFPGKYNGMSTRIAELFVNAIKTAKDLGDKEAEAYAFGNLGRLYELNGQLEDAGYFTEKARELAQTFLTPESAYLWEWQLGRILKAKGEIEGAISAYENAFNTLQSSRSDLIATNKNIRFSFLDNVEPVYRELIGLLLAYEPTEKQLKEAVDIFESLQLSELANSFGDECSELEEGTSIQMENLDKIDSQAAVIYPIILPETLEIVVVLPGGKYRNYWTPITQKELESTAGELRENVLGLQPVENILPLAQKMYDLLLRKAEQDLAASGVKNLVFVLDGDLRNIPIELLHDGDKYLVEKDYNVAVTPALSLTSSQPLNRKKIKVLAAGISKETNTDKGTFSPLNNVPKELKEKIQPPVSESEILLDENFTKQNFQKQLKSGKSNVVHLATHGKFSSNPEDTFIITYNESININELESILRSQRGKIELLVLSACETAEGDKRAVLGLAGVAVRAGAASTLATLWAVNDPSTALLMGEFYRELSDRPQINKAEALRNAQRALLNAPNSEYKHPYYWAPFVLVGNWL